MTDNRTTEPLRKLLDERGVEYETDDNEKYLNTLWNTADRDANPMNVLFQEPLDGIPGTIGAWTELHIGKVTSEQAIAATLGSEPPYDELLRCLENDWHIRASWDGLRKFWCIELTDEGVRMRDATHGTLTAEQVRETVQHVYHEGYSDGSVRRGAHIDETDWQAIADELNATLGNGTCHAESDLSEWVCSACQCWIPLGLTPENIKNASEWRYCPHCGAKVVS